MEDAFNVFLNGIAGVFVGVSILYITIRVSAYIIGRAPEKREPDNKE
jgi:hypothetical protein